MTFPRSHPFEVEQAAFELESGFKDLTFLNLEKELTRKAVGTSSRGSRDSVKGAGRSFGRPGF